MLYRTQYPGIQTLQADPFFWRIFSVAIEYTTEVSLLLTRASCSLKRGLESAHASDIASSIRVGRFMKQAYQSISLYGRQNVSTYSVWQNIRAECLIRKIKAHVEI